MVRGQRRRTTRRRLLLVCTGLTLTTTALAALSGLSTAGFGFRAGQHYWLAVQVRDWAALIGVVRYEGEFSDVESILRLGLKAFRPDPWRPKSAWSRGSGHATEHDVKVTRFTYTLQIRALPLWIPLAGFAAYPLTRLVLRLCRRSAGNRCPACHYDLTGNRSGVCPECGAPIEGRERTASAADSA